MGFNNPAEIVRSEVGRIWGRFEKLNCEKEIGLFLSLGTGVPTILRIEKPETIVARVSERFQRPLEMVRIMQAMMTDTQKVANQMDGEFSSVKTYFRFNVEHGERVHGQPWYLALDCWCTIRQQL